MPLSARLSDTTVHSGTIVAGSPNVLVGGLPAARFSDYHICPDSTSGVPHIGGKIVEGSATVIINGLMAARVGDALECMGPPSNAAEDGDSPGGTGGFSVSKDKDVGELVDKKSGKNKIDERRGSNPREDPLFTIKHEYNLVDDNGEVWASEDGKSKVGVYEYDIGSDVDVEIRSIKDIRATAKLGGEGSFSALEAESPTFSLPGFEETSAKISVLNVEAEANIQAHLDVKKKQLWAGGEAGIGGSVVEGELPFETKQLKIPFTNWGMSLGGKVTGSLLTAEAKAHAGVRFDIKRGFSIRCGGKVGAFLAGIGIDLELNIGPIKPVVIPMDSIATGMATVIIGPAPALGGLAPPPMCMTPASSDALTPPPMSMMPASSDALTPPPMCMIPTSTEE